MLKVDRGDFSNTVDCYGLWCKAGVPERHKAKATELCGSSASGGWGDTFRSLSGPADGGQLIVLLGKRGTGKTQMAVSLIAEACVRGKAARYLKAMDLFRDIRNCYRKDGPNEVETVNKLCKLDVLVVDEAHERSDSEWENRTLTNIIDRRYDSMLSTVLVSNMTRIAFADAVGPSIVSRIHECGTVIECDWPSFRSPPSAA